MLRRVIASPSRCLRFCPNSRVWCRRRGAKASLPPRRRRLARPSRSRRRDSSRTRSSPRCSSPSSSSTSARTSPRRRRRGSSPKWRWRTWGSRASSSRSRSRRRTRTSCLPGAWSRSRGRRFSAARPISRRARGFFRAGPRPERQTCRSFFPDISGNGTYGGSQPQLNEGWTLGLNLSWSLFDGGNRVAKYQEAKANLEGARQRVKSTELDIIQNVEQAEIAVEEAQERIQAAQALVASAQENFRLAQGRFDAGVGTILDLTDAQLALTQAQNTEAQALSDYRIALARLDRAVGRR